jgi:hypothetical protein
MVGGTPVAVPSKGKQRPIIQNLGPGNIYFADSQEDCAVESALKLAPGAAFEFSSPIGSDLNELWVVVDTPDTTLRYLNLGG